MARYAPDPAQRVTVFLGEAGCGKSELAVQWALTAAERRRDVHFFDLDQTKPLLLDKSKSVILDVGGNDTGARLIGGYAHLLKSADAYFVVNPYRPWSGTVAHIDGTLSAVLKAARLGLPRFLLNPTLGIGTTAEEFLVGVEQGLRLLTPYVKVEAAAVSETLLPEVEGRTELPLLPLTPRMTVPETGLDEG